MSASARGLKVLMVPIFVLAVAVAPPGEPGERADVVCYIVSGHQDQTGDYNICHRASISSNLSCCCLVLALTEIRNNSDRTLYLSEDA